MNFAKCLAFLFCALMLSVCGSACNKATEDGPSPSERDEGARIDVRFSGIPDVRGGKSSVCEDENAVGELNVWCYLDGKLDAFSYDVKGSCSVRLYEGREYSVLAIANAGRVAPPYLESDAMEAKFDLPSFDTDPFKNALPMSSFPPVKIHTGTVNGTIPLTLSRLAAKYRLKIGKAKDTVSDLEIKSVRIGNSPGSICFFKDNANPSVYGEGDCALPAGGDSEIILYLAENIHEGGLDEGRCTYVEIKGRLNYEDRPSSNAVYILDQNMSFRWYLRDGAGGDFSVRRNSEYSAAFSWSDFGWLADPEHVSVDEVINDGTYCISFCDENGKALYDREFDKLDKESVIDLYYRVLPVSDSSQVKISTDIPPESIHMAFSGKAEHLRDGIFRQRMTNNTDRESPAEIVVSVTNTARGISCSATIRLKGSGNCVEDWRKEDDETIKY